MKDIRDCDIWQSLMNYMSALDSPYSRDYIFYLHMLSQCKIAYSKEIPTAGVMFKRDHYDLLINPEFLKSLSIEERLGVIKHEMLHILNGHLTTQLEEERNPTGWNLATDCAINQMIQKEHLPQGGITPETFPIKTKCPENKSAVQYYDMLDIDPEDEHKQDLGENAGDHSIWEKSEGDSQIAKDIAKAMAEKSAESTLNSSNPGNLPGEYSNWIELLSTPNEVNWKQVLRSIVGNKRANRRKTILRRDRRNPNYEHIKGKTKDRIFELLVVSDVSGSVSNEALVSLWNEIVQIIKVTNTPTTLIQIDTEPYEPQELKKNVTKLERKASGGTVLAPALEKAKERNVHYDAIVVTTDNYLFKEDVQPFLDTGKRVVWLVDPTGGDPLPGQDSGKSTYIKLKGD